MSIPKVVNVESVLQQLATAAVIYPHLAVFAEAGVLIEAMRRQLAPEHSAPTGETMAELCERVCEELKAARERIAALESRVKPINWPFVEKPKVVGALDSDLVDLHGGEQP